MKKHLKVRAELIPPMFKEVKMTVLEQSHSSREFGGNSAYLPHVFFSSKTNVKLRAMNPRGLHSKSFMPLDGNGRTAVTLGENGVGTPIIIPIDYWPRVKETIEEYNNFYSKD